MAVTIRGLGILSMKILQPSLGPMRFFSEIANVYFCHGIYHVMPSHPSIHSGISHNNSEKMFDGRGNMRARNRVRQK